MHPLLMSLLRFIYPVELPDKKRDRPLEVLALGISRSGTESLRQALIELGYVNCYHGFNYGASPNQAAQWMRLGYAQQSGDKAFLNATEFDKVLGDCAAVTDIPCAGFAHELIATYPDAKIILNYREDIDAWAQSVKNTLEVVVHDSWADYILTFFQSGLFWRRRSFYWVWSRHFGARFEANGKEWYWKHYRDLEDSLPEGSYLKWKVEDGWSVQRF